MWTECRRADLVVCDSPWQLDTLASADAEFIKIAFIVMALGKALEMSVTAEGVETADQMSCLMKMGCFQHQGWHFARPAVSQKVREMLSERKSFVA